MNQLTKSEQMENKNCTICYRMSVIKDDSIKYITANKINEIRGFNTVNDSQIF